MTPPVRLRAALASRKGSAVVEFAITAPLLTLLLLGTGDIAPALMVRFKLGSATQVVADLATQSGVMVASDFGNLFGAGADVMAPFSGTPLSLKITNVASDGNGNAFVYWSCASGTLSPTDARTNVTNLPAGILRTDPATTQGSFHLDGTNTSVLVVESAYTYTAPVGLLFRTAQNLTNTAYTVPRVSTYVGASPGNAGYVPPVPTNTRNKYPIGANGVSCSFAY